MNTHGSTLAASAITAQSIIAAAPGQVSSTLGEEAVILDLQRGEYYGLDEVGALIWNRIQQPCSVAAICAAVLEVYDVQPAECEEDVVALLAELRAAGLIEVRDGGAA